MKNTWSHLTDGVRWTAEADSHNYAFTVFQAIVTGRGFKALFQNRLDRSDRPLRPDSVEGELLFWWEFPDTRSAVFRIAQADAVVLVTSGETCLTIWAAAATVDAARRILRDITKRFPPSAAGTNRALPFTFWHLSEVGGSSLPRRIEVAAWDELSANYCGDTRARLAALMDGFSPDGKRGKLLLWHGEPGTGKTHAIRALAWSWRKWCRFEYVTDPEELFGCGGYLTEVMLHHSHEISFDGEELPEKWRLLILEDSGEMLGVDAKQLVGQGLSRLLNLSDGILGQGTRIMILLTTNEELGKLNPAVMRPGRCLSRIEFRRFSADEANGWLRHMGSDRRVDGARTLSDLYALVRGETEESRPTRIGFRPRSEEFTMNGRRADGDESFLDGALD
jgi:hypothetical protein